MKWRYKLIDRNGLRTAVEAPGGWEGFTIKLRRHKERHGTFREVQIGNLQFYDTGRDLLRKEYELYGIRGRYDLQVLAMCGGRWEEVYRGRVGFDSYKSICDAACSVQVDLEQTGALVDFINRFDQKVDVTQALGVDGTTALPTYNTLSKEVVLTSKAIKFRGRSRNTATQEFKLKDDQGFYNDLAAMFLRPLRGIVAVPFNVTDSSGIKRYTPQATNDYYREFTSEYVPEVIFNDPDYGENPVGKDFQISFRVKGIYKNLGAADNGLHALTLVLKKGTDKFRNATTLQSWLVYVGPTENVSLTPFDITYNGTVQLNTGDLLWLNFYMERSNYPTNRDDVRIEFDAVNFFQAEVNSLTPVTSATLFLPHETASRVTEAITNGALKVKSSLYGRTNSQPFAFPQVGCAGLRGLSSGLHVRRARLADGSAPRFFLSMKELFEGLNAIDNIGVGYEGGNIVLEHWRHFYKEQVILRCTGIESLEKSTKAEEHYSIFKNGYQKWEAEDFNGLDEFLTKREWRTSLSEVQNTFEKVCPFIASGYAWEVTRRKANDTKDWRYDNDTFIVCLTDRYRGPAAFTTATDSFNVIPGEAGYFQTGDQITIENTPSNNGTYQVVNVIPIANSVQVFLNQNLVTENAPAAVFRNLTRPFYRVETAVAGSSANVLDPDTVYNFRISPRRNALRWFHRVAMGYRTLAPTDGLQFSAGEGNYLAQGLLQDGVCRIEATTASAENEAITLSSFDDPLDARPMQFAERVKFSYPLSFSEYSAIAAAPDGLIYYACKSESGLGWIDEISYVPEDGKATFILIPKRKN